MAPTTNSSADYASFFYRAVGDQSDNKHECLLCGKTITQRRDKGFTNLMSHLMSVHRNFTALYTATQSAATGPSPFESFVSESSMSMYGWIDLLVAKHLPLSTVEDATVRKYINLAPTSANTIRAVMHKVSLNVEKQIQKQLPDRFGLVFDGWSSGGTAFCCVLATFCLDGQVHTPMLAFAPMLDETDQSAPQHVEFMEATLDRFGKTTAAVTFVVGDNCNNNKAIAKRLKVPLVGCAGHRLNLAVRLYCAAHAPALDAIHDLMVRCRTTKNRAALRELAHLAPRLRNDTRWSSTYAMVERFFDIKDQLAMIPDLRSVFPSPGDIDKLADLFTDLQTMHGFTLALQRQDLALNEARALLDKLVEVFPEMAHHLGQNASIVESAPFESAVVKVLDNNTPSLTAAEVQALVAFEVVVDTQESVAPVCSKSLAMDVLRAKRAKITQRAMVDYEDLRCVLPTSNIVERLFSKAKLVFSSLRQSLTPETLEIIMFLGANRAYWNASTVEQVR